MLIGTFLPWSCPSLRSPTPWTGRRWSWLSRKSWPVNRSLIFLLFFFFPLTEMFTVRCRVADPHWFPDTDPYSAFLSMRIRSRILMSRNWRILQLKKIIIFWSKNAIYLSLVQATGEVFISQKWTSSTLKLEFSSLLWVILAFLDLDPDPKPYSQCRPWSGSGRPKLIRVRVRIRNTGYM